MSLVTSITKRAFLAAKDRTLGQLFVFSHLLFNFSSFFWRALHFFSKEPSFLSNSSTHKMQMLCSVCWLWWRTMVSERWASIRFSICLGVIVSANFSQSKFKYKKSRSSCLVGIKIEPWEKLHDRIPLAFFLLFARSLAKGRDWDLNICEPLVPWGSGGHLATPFAFAWSFTLISHGTLGDKSLEWEKGPNFWHLGVALTLIFILMVNE